MMQLRSLIVITFFLSGVARRRIRVGNVHYSAQQHTNMHTKVLEMSGAAREALVPQSSGMGLLRRADMQGRLLRDPPRRLRRATVALDAASGPQASKASQLAGQPRPVLSRRISLLLSLAMLGAPKYALAKKLCSCPSGPDSCVCKEIAESDSALNLDPSGKRRADAAGRDAIDSRRDVVQMRREMDQEQANPKEGNRNMSREKQTRAAETTRSEMPPVTAAAPRYLGLSGGGSLEGNEVDASGAKARFRQIVQDTARKREAELGFKLDEEDVAQIADSLRAKYCGPAGLIGPC